MSIIWIPIEVNKLPAGEVLAANFNPGTFGYKEKLVGTLSLDDREDTIICEDENTQLKNCSHFVAVHDYDPA